MELGAALIHSRYTVRRDVRFRAPRNEIPGAEWFSDGYVL